MKKIFSFLLLAVAAMTVSAQTEQSSTPAADPWTVASQLLQAEVHAQRSAGKIQNTCLSPLSLEMALAMAAEGASAQTADELRSLIPANLPKLYRQLLRDGSTLSAANSIWINQEIAKSVKKKFLKRNRRKYGAEVTRLVFDPAAVVRINQWCSLQTRGLIPSIIGQLERDDQMVLINALHFKTDWEDEFEADRTHPKPFHLSGGGQEIVPMMTQTQHWAYTEDEYCQAIRLPYRHNEGDKTAYAMYILLPRKNVPVLEFIDNQLSAEYWRSLSFGMPRQVRLQLPKWESQYSTSLVRPLQEMGIRRIFTPQAQFPGISRTPLMVGDILQKTFIRVDEKGTEAAAVTAVMMKLTSAGPNQNQPIEMNVNRPFLYLLVETTTQTPVFVGLMLNPKEKF